MLVLTKDDSIAFGPRIEVRATSSNGGDATSMEDGMSLPQSTNAICVKVLRKKLITMSRWYGSIYAVSNNDAEFTHRHPKRQCMRQ